MGLTQFAGEHIGGDFHRQMLSDRMNSWGFGANSYQALKHVNLWGDFAFTQKHHDGRNWSDNFDPYNGNPYQVGCGLKGDYTEQRFDFGVKLSSKRVWKRWWFGLGFDYSIGDLSRTQDPRSRVQMVDLTLTPGFSVEIAHRHHFGAHFRYRYRKEKNNPYVSKAENANEYELYLQEGLGVFQKIISSSFDRRQKGNYYGAGLTYDFQKKDFQFFTTLDFLKREDDVEDRQKASPGDYSSTELLWKVKGLWLKLNHRHEAYLSLGFVQGEARKAFQELVTVTDPITGNPSSFYKTKFSTKSLTHDILNLKAYWQYTHLRQGEYDWSLATHFSFHSMKDKYVFYQPSSLMQIGTMSLGLKAGVKIWSKRRHRMVVEGSVGYHLNLDDKYRISPDLENQDLRQSIYDVDYLILRSNALDLGLKFKYIYPLSRHLDGFVSLNGRYVLSTDETSLKRCLAGISVGFTRRF